MRSLAWIAPLVAMGILLAGCQGIPVEGVVISGEIGRVIRVSATDERLESGGIEGVEVQIIQGGDGGRALMVLAEGITDSDGGFQFSISSENLRAGRILVRAESESIFKVQNLVDLPRAGESLLVQVIERSGATGSSTEE